MNWKPQVRPPSIADQILDQTNKIVDELIKVPPSQRPTAQFKEACNAVNAGVVAATVEHGKDPNGMDSTGQKLNETAQRVQSVCPNGP